MKGMSTADTGRPESTAQVFQARRNFRLGTKEGVLKGGPAPVFLAKELELSFSECLKDIEPFRSCSHGSLDYFEDPGGRASQLIASRFLQSFLALQRKLTGGYPAALAAPLLDELVQFRHHVEVRLSKDAPFGPKVTASKDNLNQL